jgi:NADH-quinone oxidoreductase subunit E
VNTLTSETLLSIRARDQIDQWLKRYPANQKKSAVLHALRVVQEENGGWLTEVLMKQVAEYLDLSPVDVYEVATFYSMYDLKPAGCYKIKVCSSISCMLRGSDKLLNHLHKKLHISTNETTSDGLFTIKAVECLAACGGAPVLQVNDKTYYEDVTPEKAEFIINELRNEGNANAE